MTQIIILAAGKGSRMAAKVPKVLVVLQNKSLIERLLDSVVGSGIDSEPIIVVSPDNKEIIKKALNKYKVSYVIQKEQLGTGHAVMSAKDIIGNNIDKVLVLYGDHPFITGESIKNIIDNSKGVVTVIPTKVDDYSGWRHNFYHWGRFVRNIKGEITKIVEFKDASEEEKEISEVNPGFMCFERKWLFNNVNYLKSDNKAKEYYLTDMINLAFKQGHSINTVHVNPKEAIGINDKKELEIAESLL